MGLGSEVGWVLCLGPGAELPGGQSLMPTWGRAGPFGKAGSGLWTLAIELWWVGGFPYPGKGRLHSWEDTTPP